MDLNLKSKTGELVKMDWSTKKVGQTEVSGRRHS